MAIDQKKLTGKFILTGTGTAPELLAALDQLPALEKKFRARPHKVRLAALIAFIGLSTVGALGSIGFLIPLSFVVGIGLIIYSVVIAGSPIILNRAEVLRKDLQMLSEDAGSKGRFDVMLRLRKDEKQISEEPNPRKKGGKQTFLKDEWLTVTSRMSDGTTLTESYIDLIRKRTKTNPRGKTKSKERRVCMLRAQLRYNPSTYGNVTDALKRIPKPFRLPDAVQFKGVKANEKVLVAKADLRGEQAPYKLHAANQALLLGAYRILNLARRGAIATRSGK